VHLGFLVGETVTVTGLAKQPQFNGRRGTVTGGYLDGRYPVQVELLAGETRRMKIKIENLLRGFDPSAQPAPPPASEEASREHSRSAPASARAGGSGATTAAAAGRGGGGGGTAGAMAVGGGGGGAPMGPAEWEGPIPPQLMRDVFAQAQQQAQAGGIGFAGVDHMPPAFLDLVREMTGGGGVGGLDEMLGEMTVRIAGAFPANPPPGGA
jgi:hypothetical protein